MIDGLEIAIEGIMIAIGVTMTNTIVEKVVPAVAGAGAGAGAEVKALMDATRVVLVPPDMAVRKRHLHLVILQSLRICMET